MPPKRMIVSFADFQGKDLEKVQEFDALLPANSVRRRSSRIAMLAFNTSPATSRRTRMHKPQIALPSLLSPPDSTQFMSRASSVPERLDHRDRGYAITCSVSNLEGPREITEGEPVHLCYVCYHPESMHLKGSVVVLNLGYEKRVFVRCTLNGWKTYQDHNAMYSLKDSPRYVKDQPHLEHFVFQIPIDEVLLAHGVRVEFAIGFVAAGNTYWDNNQGNNYYMVASVPTPPSKLIRDTSIRVSRSEMQDLMDMSQIDLDDLLEGDVDEDELELPPSFRGTAHFTRLNNKLQTSSMPDLFDKLNLRDASSRGQEHLSEDDGILF